MTFASKLNGIFRLSNKCYTVFYAVWYKNVTVFYRHKPPKYRHMTVWFHPVDMPPDLRYSDICKGK